MAQVEKYHAGTFCWADLATHDVPAVKKFYAAVLGWEFEDVRRDGREYAIGTMRGKAVAGIVKRTSEPFMPQWLNYVAVADVDATVTQAEKLGARVIVKANELLDFARVAYIQDPSLAVVGLWQSKARQGAELVREPAAVCWNELRTRNTDAATEFYSKLLGWGVSATPDYTMFTAGPPLAGMLTMPREIPLFIPAHWLAYFAVADVDLTLETAKKAGGKIMSPPMDIPNIGRIAAIGDTAGTVFAVMAGAQSA